MIDALRRWRWRKRFLARVRQFELANPYKGTGARPPSIDVEATFDEFVAGFGGVKVSSLVADKSARPLNADYFFSHSNVLAELKTLEGSFAGRDGINVLMDALQEGGVTQAQLNDFIFRGQSLPRESWSVVHKRFRRFVEDRIRRGRSQLRRSKADVGNGATKCILLIANDQVKLVSDAYVFGMICNLMASNYSDSHIDAVVYFSTNAGSFFPGSDREFTPWFPTYRESGDVELSRFINKLGEAWLKFYAAKRGEPGLPIMQFASVEEGREALLGKRRKP